MPNPNSNPYIKDILEEQNRIIEEDRRKCIREFGENVTQTMLASNRTHCPASWDEITCWPPVLAGTIANKSCVSLDHIKGFNLNNTVTKDCRENGHWFIMDGRYWTNFTQCYQQHDIKVFVHTDALNGTQLIQKTLPILKVIKETGYSISLISLMIAILIMVTIRKLHCARNILHMHLFASFILRAFIYLLKDFTFLDGLGLSSDVLKEMNGTFFNTDPITNNWHCKFLISLWQYFFMANFSWILMEGLYLHNLIFRALFADSSGSIVGYVLMGWGLPLILVTPWILGRLFFEDTLCWTTSSSKIHLFITLPTFISVVVNLIFFVRISMVLLNKLKSPLNDDNKRLYMRWAKSTLVLVPLFGVNYIVFLGLKYIKNEVVEVIWIVCDSIFGSFQGFFVAVLYCFLNSEVKAELKLYFYRIIPFLATNKVFGICCPCREKFLRSTRARISVCTTLSCSSVYANGLSHVRNNLRNKDFHNCEHSKRTSQDTLNSSRTSVNFNQNRKQIISHKTVNNDNCLEMCNLSCQDVRPCQEELSCMLTQQC